MQRRQSSASTIAERQSILSHIKSDELSENALYIIVIRGESLNITIKWLLELLSKSKREGGGDFLLERIVNNQIHSSQPDHDSDIILQISASNTRLNISADAIELKQLKPNESVSHVFHVNGSNIHLDDCLTFSEKQRVLLHEIESLHSLERGVLFGYPHVKLYPGQSISKKFRFFI